LKIRNHKISVKLVLFASIFSLIAGGIFIHGSAADTSQPLVQVHDMKVESNVNTIATSEDGNMIVTGTYNQSGDNRVHLWTYDETSSTYSLQWNYTASPAIEEVDISDNGEKIVAAYENYTKGFDSESSAPVWSINADDSVSNIAISGNGEYIVSGTGFAADSQGIIFLSDGSGDTLWTWEGPSINTPVMDLAISDNGSTIAAGLENGTILCFKPNSNTSQWFYDLPDQISSVEVSEDGSTIAASCYSGNFNVAVLNATSGEEFWTLNLTNSCNGLSLSSDGKDVLISEGNPGNNLLLYPRSSNTSADWSKSLSSKPYGSTLAESDVSQLAVVGDGGGNFYKLNARTSETVLSYDLGDNPIMDSVISNDGAKMACISSDGNLYTISSRPSYPDCPTCPSITTLGIIGFVIAGVGIASTALMLYLYSKKR
jgi:uncharacterized protein YxeA